jgi:hypothetical protein
MKTCLFTLCSILIGISLLLAACSPTASLPSATPSDDLSQAAELAVGTIKLEGSDQAPTSEQASQLLILWKAYESLGSSDSTAQAELDGLVNQIQENMTTEQTQAIAGMQLDSQSQAEIIQSLGTQVISDGSQNASQSASTGQSGPGTPPGGDANGMSMDAAAMQSGDQALPQVSGQSSAKASTSLQQISPQLVRAVIDALGAQTQLQ